MTSPVESGRSGSSGVVVHNYTNTQRYETVIGEIQGVKLPFTVSVNQLIVGVAAGLVLIVFRDVWMLVVPPGLLTLGFLLAGVGVPMYVVRFVTLEGRSIWATALGWVTYLTRPSPNMSYPAVRIAARFQSVDCSPQPAASTTASVAAVVDNVASLPPLTPIGHDDIADHDTTVGRSQRPLAAVSAPDLEARHWGGSGGDGDEWMSLVWDDAA